MGWNIVVMWTHWGTETLKRTDRRGGGGQTYNVGNTEEGKDTSPGCILMGGLKHGGDELTW